jgi:hypothetical protein
VMASEEFCQKGKDGLDQLVMSVLHAGSGDG